MAVTDIDMEATTRRLAEEFQVEPVEVRRRLRTVLDDWSGARVRSFLSILVERRVREDLRARQRAA